MNGRIYDPLIGRFMSADPYIQAPSDLQSFNRYAYVRNNPLNLTDPSGFSWLSKTWKKAWKSPIFKAVLGIVVAFVAPYALAYIFSSVSAMAMGSLANVIATGALSGFASSGTLKGALTGAFTAGIMFGVGEIAKGLDLAKAGTEGVTAGSMMGRTALHAGAGCLSSMAGGGSCQAGAISGALGEIGTHLPGSDIYAVGVIKGAMLGGVGAKLGGGKFADGAQTGAFGYMFNHSLEHSELFKPLREMFNKGMANLNGTIKANPMQVSATLGGTQMNGVTGDSFEIGTAVDTNGNVCKVSTTCKLYGLGLGASVESNAQVSIGNVSDGWNMGLVGAAESTVAGGKVAAGYGSDGVNATYGRGRGLLGVIAVKVCTTKVSDCN